MAFEIKISRTDRDQASKIDYDFYPITSIVCKIDDKTTFIKTCSDKPVFSTMFAVPHMCYFTIHTLNDMLDAITNDTNDGLEVIYRQAYNYIHQAKMGNYRYSPTIYDVTSWLIKKDNGILHFVFNNLYDIYNKKGAGGSMFKIDIELNKDQIIKMLNSMITTSNDYIEQNPIILNEHGNLVYSNHINYPINTPLDVYPKNLDNMLGSFTTILKSENGTFNPWYTKSDIKIIDDKLIIECINFTIYSDPDKYQIYEVNLSWYLNLLSKFFNRKIEIKNRVIYLDDVEYIHQEPQIIQQNPMIFHPILDQFDESIIDYNTHNQINKTKKINKNPYI